jgi:hypothetical protein
MKHLAAAAFFAAGVLSAVPSFALTRGDLIGQPGVSGNYTRTIHIGPDTPYVNVEDQETVNLEVNGKTTTWKFNGVKPVINLREIVPEAPSIEVYVASTSRFQP